VTSTGILAASVPLPLPSLSLYVHFPWCVRKCPYCDFNSHATDDRSFPEQDYLAALLRDLEHEKHFASGRRLQTIFFGGGTPSLISGKTIAAILDTAEKQVGFANNIEITLEANPGASDQQRFHDYRAAGVNRISLGAQSFDDTQLQTLGRIHRTDETHRAVDALRAAGFDNFNLDLMFALPGQTVEDALDDLQQAIALAPTHLSWYQLTIEQNTAFHRERPARLPDNDLQFDIWQAGQQLLRARGYLQYETSAYSKAGFECRHNRHYWEFGDYLGIGAGAHGKITQHHNDHIATQRRRKTRMPEHYIASITPCCGDDLVAAEDLPVEFMMNALRLIDGVPRALFSERTGLPFSIIASVVGQLCAERLLVDDAERLAPTARGALFLDDVVTRFVADRKSSP